MAKKKAVDNTDKIEALKKAWLSLAPKEILGKTKYITKRLDAIEKEIKELQ
jgi:hypothetical protein